MHDLNLWYCNVCTSPQLARQNGLSPKAAMKHEKGGTHVKAARDQVESWKPQPELRAWLQVPDYDDLFERRAEDMQHVDSLKDLIPFWQRQVEAAERGEELRLEAFLDALYEGKAKDPWNTNWDIQAPGWAVDTGQERDPWEAGGHGWAVDAAEVDRSSDTAHGHGSDDEASHDEHEHDLGGGGAADQDAFTFVESVARMKYISGDRKRDLHDFYKSPTNVKVTRIRELISALKGTQGS